MFFVLTFVVLVLVAPLIVEISQRGGDNVVSRTGREVLESRLVTSMTTKLHITITSFGSLLSGAVATFSLIFMAGIVLLTIWLLLRALGMIVGAF
jgi:uncharacterized Tic20 family protein